MFLSKKKIILSGLFSALFCALIVAQEKPGLQYYLPEVSYNAAVPTPAAWLGFEVGEWHMSHDQLLGYMRELARLSPRMRLQEYGRSYENRPLICLTITAPENMSRLEEIRRQRQQLSDPAQSAKANPAAIPAVAYMGYSIHGNETSGSNASALVAYYLAAAQTPELEKQLRETVILFDPCFNPDGMQRFSSWVNTRRSQSLTPDPAHDEFNEPWPGGRTNHYWFDLNRDWLVTRQPESVGRVRLFQEWLPNTLTDHHEMGSNATFFFQPGVPSRVNPITPARNQELTAKIARYHAQALSEKKVLFFSGENYDDFYYGKGSTYPDANGCIGILFEQGSSRGSAQETDNGLLTFPYSIRNQVLTSLSTLKAVGQMRVELNEYLRDFYKTALDEARADDTRAYVFGGTNQGRPLQEFLQLLMQHRIQVCALQEDLPLNGQVFPKSDAYVVPVEQAQYRLIQAIFKRNSAFQDSIFYDISAWTLPDAFGLSWGKIARKDFQSKWVGEPLSGQPGASAFPPVSLNEEVYAIAAESKGYDLPLLMARLLRAGIRVKVATQPFTADGIRFDAGALLIPVERQLEDANALYNLIRKSGVQDVRVYFLTNGLTAAGPDLGSSNFATLRLPKVLLLTGRGARPEDAGEVWHLLDTRYDMPPVLVDAERFNSLNLSKYNVVVMADANFGQLSADKMREFVNNGGTLIATGASLRWLKNNNLVPLEFRNQAALPERVRRPYGSLSEDFSARSLTGAIFEAELDLTNPLCFGYDNARLPMFLSDTIFVETARNPFATPAVFTANPLLAGYIHPNQRKLVAGSAAIVVGGVGRGRVICFAGNPNFRSFWYGTNRLFANAVFFGNLINSDAVEKKK